MSQSTIQDVRDALIEDLFYLTLEGLEGAQAYVAHDHDGNAVTVETYTDEGEIDGHYTVTFNIEKQEN